MSKIYKTTEELNNIMTKDYLLENYLIKKIPEYKIGRIVGCDATTVKRRLEKYNIPRRIIKKPILELDKILNYDFLYNNYVAKDLSIGAIAQIVGCDDSTIIVRLKKFGISIKSKGRPIGSKIGPMPEETKEKIRKANSGPNCYKWKGGITPLKGQIFRLPGYKIWRFKCFKRDGFICQDCGSKGYLEVHHIKEFSKLFQEFLKKYSYLDPIKDKEKLLGLAKSYQPFWDINNGKTLCEGCHGKTYKQKGKRNGDKEIAGNCQVVNVMPLVKISLYAGNSGEYPNTFKSNNFGLQTISRQPDQVRESSETTREELEVLS